MHKERIMIALNGSDAIEMKKKFPNRYIVEASVPLGIAKISADEVYFSEKLNEHGSKKRREMALKLAVSFMVARPKEKEVEEIAHKTQDILVRLKNGEKIHLRNTTEFEVSGNNLLISDAIGVVLTVAKKEILYILRARDVK